MKMAKATADDLRRVREFFEMIEEVIVWGSYTTDEDAEPDGVDDTRLLELIRLKWNEGGGPGVGNSWRRVVFGYEVLIDD